MHMIRKYTALWLSFLLLTSALLSCGTALGAPKPDALLSFLCGDFTCGFSIAENQATIATASFVRETGCDTLIYEKNGLRVTFRFSGGESYLCTAKSETEEALILPVTLPKTHGAALLFQIFSTLPTEENGDGAGVVTRTGEGYRLELNDDATPIVWTFSTEFIPLSVTCGDTVLTVTSFSS